MPKYNVQYSVQQNARLDQVFQALADPTRRAVLARLGAGPRSTSELAQPFGMALPSFTQHLNLLENCGLVRSRKRGRIRTYEFRPQALKTAQTWLDRQRAVWEQRLDQLDNYLAEMQQEKS